ncbi:MAG: endonuclease III domain-containing protein [Candidatus Omnitrophica bacterium]|nr:endonuclease III domain-containing protein [Candidatus Omnitrophota bacterium]MCB9781789.1 endonuclease III domain-containing protein [Candidatus Omnitrophota bacterium]
MKQGRHRISLSDLPGLMEVYSSLRERFGHRDWWPGDTPFEIIVGAILTQNTAWKNVEKAIANLKREKVLSVAAMRRIPQDHLAELIRSSGYFNQKAIKLKAFISFLDEHYSGSIAKMAKAPLETLRHHLLEVKGIGPETADSILLYALNKPIFVIDAYTKRLLQRHHYFDKEPTYHEAQEFFERNLPANLDLFNDYHAQIVAVGHHYCKPKPRCEGCPLEHLPHRSE